MGVSKQDWKDYQTKEWLGGQVKSTLDELMRVFDSVAAAIDGGDADAFLSHTEDDGKLMSAAQKASGASSDALHAIQDLRLEGNQRRFANKTAIEANEAALGAVEQYRLACDLLVTDLVRGVRLEHDQVEQDQSQMTSIKSGDLADRLASSRSQIQQCYDFATGKVADLAAVDKIGVV